MFEQDKEDFLVHYGVKGMRWGVRRESGGVSRKTTREASKDAKEYASAKMYYGEGAGTRRKLINNTVQAKAKRDPAYKKAFDEALEGQDMAKVAAKARTERKHTDTKNSALKTARGVGHVIRGNSQYASLAAVMVAGAGAAAYQAGGDEFIKKHGSRVVDAVKSEAGIRAAKAHLRKMGL